MQRIASVVVAHVDITPCVGNETSNITLNVNITATTSSKQQKTFIKHFFKSDMVVVGGVGAELKA